MTSSMTFHAIKYPNMEYQIHLLNNLGSKHSPVMKFGQFINITKENFFIEKFYEKSGLKNGSKP